MNQYANHFRSLNIKLIITLTLLCCVLHVDAQKIKYRDVKDLYQIEDYNISREDQRYSPGLNASLNFIFPSIGHFAVEEYGRGLAFIGGQFLTSSIFLVGFVSSMSVDEYGRSPSYARPLMLSGLFATTGIFVWSIVDVIQVTKVKNMAFADQNLSISMAPCRMTGSLIGSEGSLHGFSLALTF